jgi:hypothetical protein
MSGIMWTNHALKGLAMIAIVAAVLFGLALIFALAGFSLGVITNEVLLLAGLMCMALHLAGVGTRTRGWRRARR